MGKVDCQEISAECLIQAQTLAVRILRNHHQAEDAVGEALLLAVKHASTLQDRGKHEAWLFRIVANVAKNIRRRDGSGNWLRRQYEREAVRRYRPPTATKAELGETVATVLAAATDRDRWLLENHYLRGRSCAEIGKELGTPASTIKRRLFNARGRLRKKLVDWHSCLEDRL